MCLAVNRPGCVSFTQWAVCWRLWLVPAASLVIVENKQEHSPSLSVLTFKWLWFDWCFLSWNPRVELHFSQEGQQVSSQMWTCGKTQIWIRRSIQGLHLHLNKSWTHSCCPVMYKRKRLLSWICFHLILEKFGENSNVYSMQFFQKRLSEDEHSQ